jgi:outer membrane protein
MKKYLVIVSIAVFVLALIQLILFNLYTPRIAYVDNNQLYQKYKGKLEIEKKYIKDKEREQALMDSLYLELTFMQKKIETSSVKNIKDERLFLDKKATFESLTTSFENRNKNIQSKYLEQIWAQINQYVKQYGKEKQYDYVLGATGNGNIMFAHEKKDVTSEVIEYINSKYDGK